MKTFDKKLYMKKWREDNKEKIKQYDEEYRAKNRDKLNANKRNKRTYRSSNLKYYYNLTLEEYENMLTSQEGCCEICKMHYSLVPRQRLCVDHCHETGKIRALLCHHCNSALGQVKESLEVLESMKKYIQTHS